MASPGSGKTATLVARVADCASRHDPQQFAVITFTNSAARELTERLAKASPGTQLGFVGTLHSYVMRLIQRHGKLIGLPPSFTLIDQEQRDDILEGIKKQHGYKGSKKDVVEAAGRSVWLGQEPKTDPERIAADYHQQMRASGTFDFDSLLAYGALLFEKPGHIPMPPTHLFVDEVQDSAAVDFRIYQAMPSAFKFFIGDERQSIFKFRGGDVNQIRAMAARSDVKVYALGLNYRSGRVICDAANRLISHNGNFLPMAPAINLYSEILVRESPNSISSLQRIALDLDDNAAWGPNAKGDFSAAVLFRYNAHVDEAVKFFQSQNIPLARRDDLVQPPDWKKARALLAVLSNPYNETTVRYYLRVAYPTREMEIVNRAATAYQSINDTHFHFSEIIGEPLAQFAKLTGMLRNEGISEQSVSKIVTAWEQLANPSMGDLIYALANDPQRRVHGAGLTVTTFHGAKGLEWDSVYIGAAEQAVTPGAKGEAALAEERRLFYVAITRAKRRLVLCHAAYRAGLFRTRAEAQQISQFVKEMGL